MANKPQKTSVTFYKIPELIEGVRYPLGGSRATVDRYFDGIDGSKTVENCQYIDGGDLDYIKMPGTKIDYDNYNYLMIDNSPIYDRRVYAYKVGCEQINNNTVGITFTVDEWTTNFDRIVMYECVMDREHETVEERELEFNNPYDPTIPKLQQPEDLAYDPANTEFSSTANLYYFPKPFEIDGKEETEEVVAIVTPLMDETTLGNDFFDWVKYFDFVACPFGMSGDPNLLFWCTTYTKYTSIWRYPPEAGATGTVTKSGIAHFRDALAMLDKYEADYHGIVRLPRWMLDQESIDPTFNKIIKVNRSGASGLQYEYEDSPAKMSVPTGELYPIIPTPKIDTITNKKLLRFPYCHILATSPNGESKEYRFEDFVDIAQGEDVAKFAIIANPGATQAAILAPLHYKFYSYAKPDMGSYRYELNMKERLEMTAYPQMSSLTDNMAIYISAKYAQNAETRTWEARYAIDDQLSDVYYNREQSGLTALGSVGGVVGGSISGNAALTIGGVAGAAESLNNFSRTWEAERRIKRDEKMRDDIQQASANRSKGYPPVTGWGHCAGSHGGYAYNPGQNASASDMFPSSKNHFTFEIKSPKMAILHAYDKWLDAFGYKSGEYKKPNIWNYISGATLGKPIFRPVDGLLVTYVKTIGAKVHAPSAKCQQYIQNMLDKGCSFYQVGGLDANIAKFAE